jgi:ABC-type nitrate/sulfonate/bicarbonate transport system permease component
MSATVAVERHRRELPQWLGGLIGFAGLLIIWEIIGRTMFQKSGVIPPPTHIIQQMREDGFEFYWKNAKVTMHEAAIGYLWGNALAILLALMFLVLPILERPLMRLGVASFCLPVIAIGPIFTVTFNGQTPKIILAAMSVFFTTLVGMLLGLRSADKTALDVVYAYGGSPTKMLSKVRIRAALPSLFAALRIAAPAAILGAIIGEYLGGESGLGIAMIASETAVNIERTWAIALVATGLAGVAYGITALIGRWLTPWAPQGGRV